MMSPEDLWVTARQHGRRITALEAELVKVRQTIGAIERHLEFDVVSDHVTTNKEDSDG